MKKQQYGFIKIPVNGQTHSLNFLIHKLIVNIYENYRHYINVKNIRKISMTCLTPHSSPNS